MKLRCPFPTWLAPILVAGALGCVSLPSPQEMLDTGFRSPEMTFHTFQMGVRADLPGLEFSCLARSFRARHDLSQLAYREFRERELEGQLAFWLGIPDAGITESVRLSRDRHLLRCESHGEAFEVELVREDFWQLWVDGQAVADEAITRGSFGDWTEVYEDGGETYVFGQAQLPPRLADVAATELDANLTEFRLGREWKIDDFRASVPEP